MNISNPSPIHILRSGGDTTPAGQSDFSLLEEGQLAVYSQLGKLCLYILPEVAVVKSYAL